MKIEVDLPDKAYQYLLQMARAAHLTVAEMVEIGAFNLVALWMREKNNPVPMDADDGVDADK
jgi:hypothetical protein